MSDDTSDHSNAAPPVQRRFGKLKLLLLALAVLLLVFSPNMFDEDMESVADLRVELLSAGEGVNACALLMDAAEATAELSEDEMAMLELQGDGVEPIDWAFVARCLADAEPLLAALDQAVLAGRVEFVHPSVTENVNGEYQGKEYMSVLIKTVYWWRWRARVYVNEGRADDVFVEAVRVRSMLLRSFRRSRDSFEISLTFVAIRMVDREVVRALADPAVSAAALEEFRQCLSSNRLTDVDLRRAVWTTFEAVATLLDTLAVNSGAVGRTFAFKPNRSKNAFAGLMRLINKSIPTGGDVDYDAWYREAGVPTTLFGIVWSGNYGGLHTIGGGLVSTALVTTLNSHHSWEPLINAAVGVRWFELQHGKPCSNRAELVAATPGPWWERGGAALIYDPERRWLGFAKPAAIEPAVAPTITIQTKNEADRAGP